MLRHASKIQSTILRVCNLSQRTISFRDTLELRIEYRKSSITACAPGRKLREERTRPLSFHFFERHVPGVVNIQCIRSTIGYKSYPLLYFSPAIPQRQLNNFLKRRTPSDVGGRRNLWRVRQHPDRWCTARGSRSRILPPLHPSFIISRLLYPVFRLFRDAPWNIGSTLPNRLHVSFSKWIFINREYDYSLSIVRLLFEYKGHDH